MGQSFSLFSASETPSVQEKASGAPVETSESSETQVWDGQQLYIFLQASVIAQAEKDPYATEFIVQVLPSSTFTPEAQEEALKTAGEYGWKIEVSGSTFRIGLPISSSSFLPKSEYNVAILYETVRKGVQQAVKQKPYVNTHEVTIPISFMKSFNEEENKRRQAVRESLLERLQKLRWEVTFNDDHPFQTTVRIRVPPALPH